MEIDDKELIQSYLNGNEVSFSLLVKKNLPSVYNFVKRLYNNESDATDISQEVFVKVWKNIHKYNPEQNFKTWLFTIARNTTYDWMRKKKVFVFSDLNNVQNDEEFADTLVDTEPLPDTIFEQKDLKNKLNTLIQTLTPDQKTVITLHINEEMTFEEIGIVLDKPQNTIKSHYRRGLAQLRKSIESAPIL